MGCIPVIDPTCIPGAIASNAATSMLETLARGVGAFVTELLKLILTGWLRVPSPQVAYSVDAALHGQATGTVAQLRASTGWIVAALAVGSLLVAAARIAISRSGREAAELGRGILHLVVLSGLGIPIVLLLTEIGDAYSIWIIDRAAGGQFEARASALFTIDPDPAPGNPLAALGVVGVLLFGLVLAFTLLVQILLMLGRTVGLVLLTGLIPVAAAGGMVGRGVQTRDRYLAWLLAFVLYKPVAATIYATGFWLIGEGRTLTDVFAGMMTFLIAIVALPALMRLISPSVGPLADGAGAGAMAGMAMTTSVATGALAVGAAMHAATAAGASGSSGGAAGGAAGGGDDAHGGAGGGRSGSASGAAMTAAAAGGGVAGLAAGTAVEGGKQVGQAADTPRRIAGAAGQTGATGATGSGGQT